MRVLVQSLGAIKDLLKSRELPVELPEGATLDALLRRLAELAGPEFTRVVNTGGAWPALHARILVNGRDHYTLQELQTPLAEGDRVMLLPPMAGG